MVQGPLMRDETDARAPAARLAPADHACWFFRSRDEHREGIVAFVRQAVEHRARVLYLADAIPPVAVVGDLEDAGLEPSRLAERGQLILLSEGYGHGERFDPDGQVERYRALARESRATGYEALWITGEGTWEIRGDVAPREAALRYEGLTEELLSTADDVVALCQYEAAAVPPASAELLRRTHNLEVLPTELRVLGRRLETFAITPTDEGVALSGSVDLQTWAAFGSSLHHVVEEVEDDPVVDLADIAFIDAHGLGIIAESARTMRRGRRLVLRGLSPMLARVARAVGLHDEPNIVIEWEA